ncbi:hypothetical protein [Pseudonocardia nigra]|uniref:hypothetical protein n=1 Tax=Pseudonocardia nigra TaxID=1921578 RepID=UPI001C5FA874|nr:hypothetical protein [Pseudonocardia nigra]
MELNGQAEPGPAAVWNARANPPDNEVPAALPWAALLGRGEDTAVALTGAAVYSTGLRLDIAARARRRPGRGRVILFDAFGGRGAAQVLLGVEYADGRTTTNASPTWPPAPGGDDAPWLQQGGGSGGDRSVDMSFFLSPLPPPGPLTLVCAWPDEGIDETQVVFDAREIEAALRDVVELWPPEDDAPEEPEPPEPPDVPGGGWFARALGTERDVP